MDDEKYSAANGIMSLLMALEVSVLRLWDTALELEETCREMSPSVAEAVRVSFQKSKERDLEAIAQARRLLHEALGDKS